MNIYQDASFCILIPFVNQEKAYGPSSPVKQKKMKAAIKFCVIIKIITNENKSIQI